VLRTLCIKCLNTNPLRQTNFHFLSTRRSANLHFKYEKYITRKVAGTAKETQYISRHRYTTSRTRKLTQNHDGWLYTRHFVPRASFLLSLQYFKWFRAVLTRLLFIDILPLHLHNENILRHFWLWKSCTGGSTNKEGNLPTLQMTPNRYRFNSNKLNYVHLGLITHGYYAMLYQVLKLYSSKDMT